MSIETCEKNRQAPEEGVTKAFPNASSRECNGKKMRFLFLDFRFAVFPAVSKVLQDEYCGGAAA